MSIGFIFWLLMILWFFSWAGSVWAADRWPWGVHFNGLLFFVLLFLLGWHSFGFVIHD